MSVGWKSNAGGGGSVTIASSDSSISVVEAPAGTFDLKASAATVGAVDITGDTMQGPLLLDGYNLVMGAGGTGGPGNITTIGSVAATVAVTAPLINGVALTTAGSATAWLNGLGGYTAPAAADIAYTPTYATSASVGNPSTTVGEQLLWNETNIGPGSLVWDEPTLESGFPLAGGTHTIDRSTLWLAPRFGAPIGLTPGSDVRLANPGSIDSLGEVKVALVGDVPGPLVHGECVIVGLSIININGNPAAEDLQVESLAGRTVGTKNVTLLGFGGSTIENVLGGSVFSGLVRLPPFGGAGSVIIDGVCGSTLFDEVFSVAPGGVPFTAFKLAPTATVTQQLKFIGAFDSALGGDALLELDPAATVPTGPIPTGTVGLRIVDCSISGPGSLFASAGLGADSIKVSSSSHLNGERSNFVGDARVDTAGAPPSIVVDHTGNAGVPLLIPSDNSQNGGVGGTLRSLALTASTARHTLITGSIEATSINTGGTYTGADGDYPATQASTTGTGTGAEFVVTLTGGTVTAVVSVDKDSGYADGDTITLSVVGPTETVAAVLDVDADGWYIQTDGAEGPLSGTAQWAATLERGGGGTSNAYAYIERKLGFSGAWAEVAGSSSTSIVLPIDGQRVAGGARLNDINSADRWRVVLVQDAGGSPLTDVERFELLIVGEP